MSFLKKVTKKIFGDGGAKQAKKAAKQVEQEASNRKSAIAQGTQKVRGAFDSAFTPEWFNSLRQSYENYYMPQLETQHQDARKQALYGLTRQGLGQSSVRGDWFGQLQNRFNQAKQDVVSRAESTTGQRQAEVGRALETSLMQLNAAEDPLAAASIGAQNARLNAYPTDYQPLGQVFTDMTNYYAQQRLAQDRGTAPAGGGAGIRGWFNNSGTVRR